MRGENHHYVFANFRKQIVEPPALGRIESGCGLIDDDKPGFANQRLGDAESLFHASGKRVDAFLAHVPEICLHKQLFHKSISRGTFCDAFVHEEPLKIVPREARSEIIAMLNESIPPEMQIRVEGDLDPFCRKTYDDLLQQCDGDWRKVMDHVVVKRFIVSEKDRRGIGTFQPKDEKNQDSTELTGDINFRKIAEYGSDSDPRAFNFDGELNIANRGIIEFIEVLKLDVAFLYDLLGASQEHVIKPKKFAQTNIDEVIIGHTNEPEYKKLQNNELMEAFRDRTIKIDVPYNVVLDDEQRIYEKDFNKERVRSLHIAPHTIETASMWAVLTRLQEPKKAGLTRLQKLKLYNGKSIPGFTAVAASGC